MREIIIKRVAKKFNLEENVVNKIVSHQFVSANTATDVHNSVEFSGLGKFVFNEKKACSRFEKYVSQFNVFTELLEKADSQRVRNNILAKLDTVNINMKHLKPKLYVIEGNSRGMEE